MARWWYRCRREFGTHMLEYADKPVTYVQIGCWQGEAAEWMCENVLTHPDARGYGIDPYKPMWTPRRKVTKARMDMVKAEAHERLLPHPQWTWIEETSEHAFRRWRRDIDLLLIDGPHEACNALMDFTRAWPFMQPGGMVVMDDLEASRRKRYPFVIEAVAAVLLCYDGLVEPLWSRHQMALRVTGKRTNRKWADQFTDYQHAEARAIIASHTKQSRRRT